MRVAVVSTAVPPAWSGQARVLGQIFAPVSGVEVVWFTDQSNQRESAGAEFGKLVSLGSARFGLLPSYRGTRLAKANNSAGLVTTVVSRAREIAADLRAEPVKAVIAASGSPFDIPAAWLAAEWLGLPFFTWLFDDPVMQWSAETPYRNFMRMWERAWARRCFPIAPNEVMALDFAKRNPKARSSSLIRNPAPAEAFAPALAGWPTDISMIEILYTGSVYGAQLDALQNLAIALDRLDGFYLTIRTAQSSDDLAGMGLRCRKLRVLPHLPHEQSLAAQHAADILFLPLAFNSAIPEVIRSSAPAKAAEYLASGRPILVHAPAGSYVSTLFGAGSGLVVDKPDPDALAAALLRIRDERSLREMMTESAASLAAEFRVEESRARLMSALAEGLRS